MEEIRYSRDGRKLDIELKVKSSSSEPCEIIKSREYVINGLVVFQIKMNIYKFENPQLHNFNYHGSLSITLCKTLKSDILTYAVKCSTKEFIKQKYRYGPVSGPVTFIGDDTSWRQIYEYSKENQTSLDFKFVLTMELNLQTSLSRPVYLHNDTDLTDFELRGMNGSVHVHKTVLAGYSPVLRSLVAGDWREAKEGCVNVEGTTKETLQHLKDYMYNDQLPENGLQQLIALACYYMMEDLVQKCSFKLLDSLSAQNAFEIAEFATKYKAKHLFYALLENVKYGNIKVLDMEKLSLAEKSGHTNNDDNNK